MSFFFFFKPFSVISNFKNLLKFSKNYIKDDKTNKMYFYKNLFFCNFYYNDNFKILLLKNKKFHFFSKLYLIKPFSIISKYNYVKVYLKKFYFYGILNLLKTKLKKKFINLNFISNRQKPIKWPKKFLKYKPKLKNFNLLKKFKFNYLKYFYLNKNIKFLFNFKVNLNLNKNTLNNNKTNKFLFNFKFKLNNLLNCSLKLQKFRLIYYFYYFSKKIKNIKFITENCFFVKNFFENKVSDNNKFFFFNIL